ncbi:methyltransferase domain-containing protein [Candidatus Chloroploca sp. M-50]|uniref:tRNA (guanine(46)-N(7))-methyltransferase n=1 Tax=Candidatus Chloroploca mongolica TaxID=2528176 RepID=A0ABS4D9R3_9CHLR|nr:methyltransferase domain-containing protein [Candidatus Chloroploca mongolica]MBP1466149.1 methyltransferase domain-containing protein [Candidatus Chloroploca mongolica]
MGRGRYPARLKVVPPPEELAARYLHVWPGHTLYAYAERFPPLSSPGLFGNEQPLALDIGCATGDLVLALAAAYPDRNYVGLDIVAKPLWRAVERAVAADLRNVCFIQADARLAYRQIPAVSLAMAYVYFPAPLLRNRQRNQRLISPILFTQMERCLAPEGRLSIMTDQPALFAECETLLLHHPGLRPLPPEHWSPALTGMIKSHYYQRWEARGRPILRLELMHNLRTVSDR